MENEAEEESDGAPPPDDAGQATFARVYENLEFFFAHGMLPLSLYRPEIDILRSSRSRIRVGIGEESVGEMTFEIGLALASRLGSEPVLFPGDHLGYVEHAEAFARNLVRAFGEA